MYLTKLLVFNLIFGIFIGSSAYAGQFYGDINAGTNLGLFAVVVDDKANKSLKNVGIAVNGDVGYAFNAHHALEVGAMYGSLAKDDIDNSANNSDKDTLRAAVPFITYRYETPLYKNVHFIGKLGAMYLSPSFVDFTKDNEQPSAVQKHSMILPMDSLGLGYQINPHLETTVQYQGLLLGIINGGQLTGGLNYKF